MTQVVKVAVEKLNVERLLELADAVEREPQGSLQEDKPGFNMCTWDEAVYVDHKICGSCRCIGGMADTLFHGHFDSLTAEGVYDNDAGLALDALYSPYSWDSEDDSPMNPWHATPQQAAAAIRHLAETGEVDWDWAMEAAAPVPEVPQ